MAPAPRGSASGQKFPCSQCDKTFSRKEYMARHFRSKHSKEKPFACEYCSHGFSRSDLLRRHYKTCSEAKALGVSGPPPGSEKPSSSRAKPKRTPSGSGTSPEPDASPEPGEQDEDEFMLPTPPDLPIASTSSSTSPAIPPSRRLPTPSEPVQQTQSPREYQHRPEEPPAMNHSPYYHPAPPSHSYSMPHQPHPHYNAAPLYHPYAHAQYYHPYPQQYPGPPHHPHLSSSRPLVPNSQPESSSPPTASSSYAANTNPNPPKSDSVAAESLTHYLRQHQQSLQHQTQPAPLPMAPPPPTQSRPQNSHTFLEPSPPASSSSAFRPGTATTDTLAPGLSGTGSFSADEVLASEVLRDLMKSPMSVVRPGMSRGDSGELRPAHPSIPVQEDGVETLQREERSRGKKRDNESNAVLLGNHQNEWGLMGGTDGFGSTRTDTPIEESPAAIALADYFNKGGVGGISALDLGFPTEPALFADWILNPSNTPFQDEADQRFEISEQMFHLAYLFPWHVPPIKTLSQYAKRAAETMLPSIPVFHAPTLAVTKMAPHGAFALTVVGGAYETEGQSFSNEMLVEKRVFLIRGFMDPAKDWNDRFASLQSTLLYQLLGFFHRDEQQRLLAQQFHTSLIYMLKQLDVPKKVRETPVTLPPAGSSPEIIEQAWKGWVEVETWKRVTFIVFLTDLEHSIATGAPQFVQLSDMDLDLPSAEFVWSAENAGDWHARALSCAHHPPMSFLAAVRALLAHNPEPFSEHSIVLAELSRLSSFPLLILSRMLSYMEKKCEEALQQVDPFKPLLGGLGMAASREQENRTMLVRIRNGREILRALPGGIARGGGERWFQDTMPSAFGGAPRRESSTSTSASDPSCSSSSTKSTKTSSPATGSEDSLNTPPQDTFQTFMSELEEEESYGRTAEAYKPYHGEGGAWPGESYEEAQDRLRKLREARGEAAMLMMPLAETALPY